MISPLVALAGKKKWGMFSGRFYYTNDQMSKVVVDKKLLDKSIISFSPRVERVTSDKESTDRHPSQRQISQDKQNAKIKKILVTGYSSTPDQCWGNPFITASGTRVHVGTMACPPEYPFGTKVKIKDVGVFVCEDRGGAIKGNHFDMWFTSRSKALAWGRRIVEAEIIR